ncbi:MAG: GGDEF domain-containing protein [Rhodanobacteraceae bacterium]|nr:GGDEF domain-containing protein [Rhodanobacteraceae bacterium]
MIKGADQDQQTETAWADEGSGTRVLGPRQRFVARMAVFVLALAASGGGLAWFTHGLSHTRYPPDLVIPPTGTLVTLAVLIVILLRPHLARRAMLVYAQLMIGLLAVSAAWFLHAALEPGSRPLVEMLPPVSPMLVALLAITTVFFQPATALRLGLGAWLLVALPLLIYMIAHPDERESARGLELMMMLGPLSLLMAIMIPLQLENDRRLTELTQAELQARNRALRDPLTDLFNRRAFEDRLAGVIAQSSHPQQLILLDIDHFKAINDKYGHPVGDQVIREVGRRCSSLLGRGDIFARWGGEEFAAICAEAENEPAAMAERMRRAIEATPIEPAGRVTASLGVTRVHGNDTLQGALKRADEALYAAKQRGRNRVVLG